MIFIKPHLESLFAVFIKPLK